MIWQPSIRVLPLWYQSFIRRLWYLPFGFAFGRTSIHHRRDSTVRLFGRRGRFVPLCVRFHHLMDDSVSSQQLFHAILIVAPAWWQELAHLLLQFTTGYMVYDTVFSIYLPKSTNMESDDWVFLAHHIATSVYMTSARIMGAGHQSAMICMFLGEATNPFHNMFYFLQEAVKLTCCNGALTQTAMYVNTFVFCSTYVVIRAVLAPPVLMLHASYDLLANGRKDIPLWVMIMWIALIWGVAIGSIPWIEECWGLLMDYFPGNEAAAEL